MTDIKMSLEERAAFIDQFFDGKTPGYLWYNIGPVEEGKYDITPIQEQTKCGKNFGDVEIHTVYPDFSFENPVELGVPEYREKKPWWMNIANLVGKGDTALRVRGPGEVPLTLDFIGRQPELYEVNGRIKEKHAGANFAQMIACGPESKKELAESFGFKYDLHNSR